MTIQRTTKTKQKGPSCAYRPEQPALSTRSGVLRASNPQMGWASLESILRTSLSILYSCPPVPILHALLKTLRDSSLPPTNPSRNACARGITGEQTRDSQKSQEENPLENPPPKKKQSSSEQVFLNDFRSVPYLCVTGKKAKLRASFLKKFV